MFYLVSFMLCYCVWFTWFRVCYAIVCVFHLFEFVLWPRFVVCVLLGLVFVMFVCLLCVVVAHVLIVYS